MISVRATKGLMALRLSVLDHATIDPGEGAAAALMQLDQLAQRAEELGYEHLWLSEHHGQDFTASTAPEILLARLASNTSRIGLGSGGVMLPNYAAYKVAEVFNTLAVMAPGRVNLGVGRATGADLAVTAALNEEKERPLPFDRKFADLLGFLGEDAVQNDPHRGLLARPVPPTAPTPWILSSGTSTAQLAGRSGVGFNFAHFINPSGKGARAAQEYRMAFRPSRFLAAPSMLVTAAVSVADTEARARELADARPRWLSTAEVPVLQGLREEAARTRNRERMLVGTGKQVYRQLQELARAHGTDQVMVNTSAPGVANQLRALQLLAEARDGTP